jgi:hypothetical protein
MKLKKNVFLCGHGKKWLGVAAATHPKELMEAGCKPSTIGPVGKQGSTGANQVLKKQSPLEAGTARRAVRGRLGEAPLPKPDLRPSRRQPKSALNYWGILPIKI